MNKLTIAISTVKVSENSELINKVKCYEELLGSDVFFLIISQKETCDKVENISDKISICYSQESGLSKSRNLAIDKCNTDWVWFQDDDIELDLLGTKNLVANLKNELDFCFGRVGSLEQRDEFYKNYNFQMSDSILNALKISSIEIVAKVSFLRRYNVKFNENLGLGTALPSCEENLFLLNAFKLTPNYTFLKDVCCYHTTLEDSRDIDHLGRFKARGYLLRHLPIYYSLPLLLRWSFRKAGKISRYKRAKLMINSYLMGF